MKILYFIPARGGSKGLPGKNIKELGGKPLIAHSIEAALKAEHKGKVVVSTDDAQIAAIAKQFGAEVPALRPKNLAEDSTPTMDVLLHFLEAESKNNNTYDVVVLLQPTSPLRSKEDIDNAFMAFEKNNAAAVVSVCECDHHPLWANELPENLSMKGFLKKEVAGKNRQQLPKYYMLNGAIYLAKTDHILSQKNFLGDDTTAYVMPRERSVDIDSEADFVLAEYYISK
ncbi:MAG: N-acylneuraminate cytidylyltransferase [Bacteroidetes bacterium]|nr:N-acylneuraminate cytidylyltransferase [Bacteroidota bacterium]